MKGCEQSERERERKESDDERDGDLWGVHICISHSHS